MGVILLATINAKWIHPSLALRLLKANLGEYEHEAEILEFAIRQPFSEKLESILKANPRILGLSVAIWNHVATKELLEAAFQTWGQRRPVVILGGPEASSLDENAPLFRYADYVVRGEGEIVFRELCAHILKGSHAEPSVKTIPSAISVCGKFIAAKPVDLAAIDPGYRLYTQEDLTRKLTYVEASRGCPFDCEFCMSSLDKTVRFFPLASFLKYMEDLFQRGARAFKFLDRTFNLDTLRAASILEFFLARLEQAREARRHDHKAGHYVHFEMIPSRFPTELRTLLMRFPPSSLRLEVGVQTFNAKTSALINRKSDPEKELEHIVFLREKTNAVIHADLIAGLPGEDFASFANGFNRLWQALSGENRCGSPENRENRMEIQLGILKCLPGTPLARKAGELGLCFSEIPPYDVLETSALSCQELDRIKNFARFWELLVNRGAVCATVLFSGNESAYANAHTDARADARAVFERFMYIAGKLRERFGRNWGIDKKELLEAFNSVAASLAGAPVRL
ncbi:MAG: B12-binding domain-containing radical SAM protein [Treponema sp.]|jgi:radical SAM superfamily enzyme YgiQ (UPF0313 family)|nr:B12-binding domain-containing radical SAM protein [Treponema sp.]